MPCVYIATYTLHYINLTIYIYNYTSVLTKQTFECLLTMYNGLWEVGKSCNINFIFHCCSSNRNTETDSEATYNHYRDSFMEVLDEIEV